MSPDLRIPGKPFTFRTLAQAQAVGDIQALHANEQQAIVLPLGNNPIATIQALTKSLAPRTPVRHPTNKLRTKSGRTRKK
jgi:glucose-6-phosphate isomerase/transaldolase/glucose-6-phosphate isomerase